MRTIGVIPGRFGSSRLEGKPLVDILGKPMIRHVYELALEARSLDRVVVATDGARIVEAVEGFGGCAVLIGPDHASGADRVAEVARDLDVDVVVNIQGDEPLLDPLTIDECLRPFLETPRPAMATVMKRIGEESYGDPAIVKVVCDLAGRALYFSRSLIPYPTGADAAGGELPGTRRGC